MENTPMEKSSRTTLHYIVQKMVHMILSYPPGFMN